MKITPLKFSVEELLAPSGPRGEGDHCSDIIKYLLQSLDPKRYSKPIDLQRAEVGFMWEEIIGDALARRGRNGLTLRQQELEHSGILFTPDAFSVDHWRNREYKASWISTRQPITSHRFWHWIVQSKAYCKVLGTNVTELYPLHVNGDYSFADPGGGPQIRPYTLEFSARELEENWTMLMNGREAMHKERKRGR